MTVITFPGQGAQKPGLLAPWLEDETARDTLNRLSEAAEIDLITHGTESDAATIKDTAVAQPLIVAAGIISWDALVRAGAVLDQVAVAGHSVGEITAAYAAGVFDADTAIRFVTRRARLMAADAAAVETGMAAVVGGDQDEVEARIIEAGAAPANFNGAGQIVAAGTPAALDELRANPPKGARVLPLKVAGAFHTSYMQDASDTLAQEADSFPANEPTLTLYSNESGQHTKHGEEYRELLVRQIANPVHWDRCMESFARDGHRTLIEMPPAGTLAGLAKRALPEFSRYTVNTPNDIDTALTELDTQGTAQ